MGIKVPTVNEEGLPSELGSAYDVVKEVYDNLDAIKSTSTIIEELDETVTEISAAVESATEAANNANAVVTTLTNIQTDVTGKANTVNTQHGEVIQVLSDVQAIQTDLNPKISTVNTQYNSVVDMYDDIDADRVAAEQARTRAEEWATKAVDVFVIGGQYSALHHATKAAGSSSTAEASATTATNKANDAVNAATLAQDWATKAEDVYVNGSEYSSKHYAAKSRADRILAQQAKADADTFATNASNSAVAAGNHVTTALGHANTALGYKNDAFTYMGRAEQAALDAQAAVGGDFVPSSRTVNSKPLNTNIVLNATDVGARSSTWVPTFVEVTSKPTTVSGYGITDAQPLDATLTAVAGVTTAADRYIFFTGVDIATVGTITAFGRSLIDDVDAATARTTLGLGTAATQASTAFQAADADLTAIAALSATSGILRKTAVDTWALGSLSDTDIPNLNTSKLTAGILPLARGGIGVDTVSGLLFGNGTSAVSAATSAQIVSAIGSTAVANATTATTAGKLTAPVTINGISFDGSANITIPAPGNVATADALTTARAITVTGDADWTVNFKGDAAATAALTLKPVVTAGTGTKLTYNAKGLITGSAALVEADIPALSWSKITSGVPNFALVTDGRFTDAREWTAATVTQAVAEAGIDTTRTAWTAERVKQAIAAQAAPKTTTESRLVALETAPNANNTAKKALAIAIIGL